MKNYHDARLSSLQLGIELDATTVIYARIV